jgi:hypothetical protein
MFEEGIHDPYTYNKKVFTRNTHYRACGGLYLVSRSRCRHCTWWPAHRGRRHAFLLPEGPFAGGGAYIPTGVIGGADEQTGWLLYATYRHDISQIYIANFNGTDVPLTELNAQGNNKSPVYAQSEDKVYLTSDCDSPDDPLGLRSSIYRWNRTKLLATSVNAIANAEPPSIKDGKYIAGMIETEVDDGSGSHNAFTPGYWRVDNNNPAGKWCPLEETIGFTNSRATSIFVDDDGIYAAGSYNANAVWWKVDPIAGKTNT